MLYNSPVHLFNARMSKSVCLFNREDLAKVYLPVGQMLQIDRVLSIEGPEIHAEMDLVGHWVFPLHFPNDPVFPGCLLIEAAGQLVAIWGWHAQLKGNPRMAKVSANFLRPIIPEQGVITLKSKIQIKRHVVRGNVQVFAGGELAAEIEPVIVIVKE